MTSASAASINGDSAGDSVVLKATDVSTDGTAFRPKNPDGTPASIEYRRMAASLCHNEDFTTRVGQVGTCADGEVEGDYQATCDPGEVALEPVFVQSWTNNPDGTISGLSEWTP
ncbi:hypothetical protein NKG05_01630 [Oerskovia sp. M15]